MKINIHPTYYSGAQISCACGSSSTVGSTRQKIKVEICAACHPFFTGEMKYVDTAGKVDKFQEKLKAAQQSTYMKKKDKKAAKKAAQKAELETAPQTIKEMMARVRMSVKQAKKTIQTSDGSSLSSPASDQGSNDDDDDDNK